MSQRRAGAVNRCPNCRINQNLCVCAFIKTIKLETNVSLVVHVSELKLTSNTAQFVEKLLPDNAKIYIRGKVFETFDSAPIMERPGRPLFLYPAEDSLELNEDFKAKYPGPYHVIIPDGNWNQAKKVRKREEAFTNIPAVKLPPGIVTEYQLRRAPQPNWVSTFEAVAHTLAILEGPEVRDHMMTFFREWVKTTLFVRKTGA